MKLSKYTRVVNLDNGFVYLYATANRAIVALPELAVNDNCVLDDVGKANLRTLEKMGFFASEEEMRKRAMEELDNSNKLFISVELNHSCNLRCPYCYQGTEKHNSRLSPSDIDGLMRYCRWVFETSACSDLYLKVLGGEPTLAWELFEQLHSGVRDLCHICRVKYHLLVDTNGTRVDELSRLSGFDTLLFTIPLTHKACHDKMRYYADKNGSYDDIVDNVNKLHQAFPHSKIILRHNTDGENIRLFPKYIDDISKKCSWKPWVSLNYTGNFNGDEFDNTLDYAQFIEWSCSEAIEVLLRNEMPILTAPLSSIEECQWRSKHSLKLFVDGTVGNCAMSYYESDRPSLESVLAHIDAGKNHDFFLRKRELTLAAQDECLGCASLFLCGGTKKLPCIQAVSPGPCEYDSAHNIDIERFLRTYYDAKERGLGNLFVVFEGGEGYR